MKTISAYRKSLLPTLTYSLSASISALFCAWVLNWLITFVFPKAMDDFSCLILCRVQILIIISVLLIIVVTFLIDKAYLGVCNRQGLISTERKIDVGTKSVGDNLLDYVLQLDSRKDRFIMQFLLTIGLGLHLLLIGYLAFYGHQQFLMSLNLLIGGPGPIIVIEPILLAANTLFIFCILIIAYFWGPIWLNRSWGSYGVLMASLRNTLFRIILIMMTVLLYNYTIIRNGGLKNGSQVIFTFVLGLVASFGIVSVLTWRKSRETREM